MDTVTLNISLPSTLARVVDRQVQSGEYASRSEFFRTLLRLYDVLVANKSQPIELLEFEKVPLKQIEREFMATGKYSKSFVRGIVAGLKREGLYANS